MSVLSDLDAELAGASMRLDRARVAVSMLADLVDQLGARGFEVDVIQSEVDGTLLHVALRIGADLVGSDADRIAGIDDAARHDGPVAAFDLVDVYEVHVDAQPVFATSRHVAIGADCARHDGVADVPVSTTASQATAGVVAAAERAEACPDVAAPSVVAAVALAPAPEPVAVAKAAAGVTKSAKASPPWRWTEDEDALFIKLKIEGVAMRDIAKAVGRGSDACSFRWSSVLRARVDEQRSLARDGAVPDVPSASALASFDVSRMPPADGWTQADDTRLRDYMAKDMGLGSTAALLQRKREQVLTRWYQMQAAIAQVSA